MTPPSETRPRSYGGVVLALVVVAIVAVTARTYGPLTPHEAGMAVGFGLGVLIAIPLAWGRTPSRGALSALASLLLLSAYVRQIAPTLRAASSAQHSTPTLRAGEGGTWLVHPMHVEVRVPSGTVLDEDEAALRATRYPTLPPEMTGSSWSSPAAGLGRLDLLVVRVDHVSDRFCASAVAAGEQALRDGGASVDGTSGDDPCDRTIRGSIGGRAFATRMLAADADGAGVFITTSALGEPSVVEETVGSTSVR